MKPSDRVNPAPFFTMTLFALASSMSALKSFGALLASALLWMLLLVLAGLAAIVAGVFTIYGAGPALLAGGVACLILAALIFLGIRHA